MEAPLTELGNMGVIGEGEVQRRWKELDMLNLRRCIDIFGISRRRINHEVEMRHHIHEAPRSTQ